MTNTDPITIETVVNASLERTWKAWTEPEHIRGWAFASSDWEAPSAENDLRAGGRFKTRMQAKDGSVGFDFTGAYIAVEEHELIEYNIDDGRHVKTVFTQTPEGVHITQTFDPEGENPRDMQRDGWQAILDNFKEYVENDTSES